MISSPCPDVSVSVHRQTADLGRLKRDVVALWLAARDPRVPWHGVVAAYALSPIDLVPDFIPVIGLIDDLLIVPAGVALVVRLIPTPDMEDLRIQSANRERPRSVAGLLVILIVWLGAAAITLQWIRGHLAA